MHLFGHTFDHDYYFELPRKGERDAQSISRCSTAHLGAFRALLRTVMPQLIEDVRMRYCFDQLRRNFLTTTAQDILHTTGSWVSEPRSN